MYKKVHNNIEYGGQTFTDSHILFLHLRTSHILLRPTLSQLSMKYTSIKILYYGFTTKTILTQNKFKVNPIRQMLR